MTASRLLVLLATALLLSACATRLSGPQALPQIVEPAAVAAAQARQAERVAWLQLQPVWSLEGRIAISNGSKGGSGRIDWKQDGDQYVVSLSAPVTRQSWRLTGDLHSEAGRLEGLEGGVREGADAEQLLLEATGWDIPLQSLVRWTRAMADVPVRSEMPAEVEYATDGRLRSLREQGWRIDYLEWFESVGSQPTMPRRIEASRDAAKVRLIIDRWSLASP